MPVRQLFSLNDLPGVDSSPNDVRQAFARAYGETPDGIAVNSETYFSAVTPAITEQYGHQCYKVLGDFQYTESSSLPPQSAIVGSNYAINEGNETVTIEVSVNGSWTESTEVSSSLTAGMSFTESFTLEGIFKIGSSFNVSTTAGKSETKALSRTATSSVSVPVPPKSKVKVSMVATLQQETLGFSAPLEVHGMFGANFPDRVKGHYFHFSNAKKVLPKANGKISGTVTNTSALHTQTTVGQAEPL